VETPINTPENIAALDAEKRYRRARVLSNIGFVAGCIFVFVALWHIGAKGTPLDPKIIFSSLIGVNKKQKIDQTPWNIEGLELEDINGREIPDIFMENDPPPPTKTTEVEKTETPVNDTEQSLKMSLEQANHLFRSWRFDEAETAYVEIIKLLPELRALKLQRDISNMFFNQGMKFYKDQQYKKALDVLRIALHFDAKNKLAHKFTAQTYRKLGQGSKAKYHERMADKL
jgi:tetratricopeptide (TPR) repeat protein